MCRYFLLFIISFLLLVNVHAKDEILIKWPKFHWPPFNTLQHDGYFDLQHQYITSMLEGFQHELIEKVPPNRLVHDITTTSEQAYCYWGMEKSALFKEKSLYSDLVGFAPELQMVMTKQTRKELYKKYGQPISLQKLITDNQYRPTLEKDRPLSDEIQSLIAMYKQSEKIQRLQTGADPYQKYNLVLRDRYSIILENFIAYYWVKNNHPNAEALTIEPFAEQQRFFSKYYVVCNNSDDSVHFINALNQVLNEFVNTNEFMNLLSHFYDNQHFMHYKMISKNISK